MKRFNVWLATKVTAGIGTMWCAYLFTLIALVGYPYGSSNLVQIVQWFAQEFLQLVLLSVILVGQTIQTSKHDEIISHVKKIHKQLKIKE